MTTTHDYTETPPSRAEIDAQTGLMVLEFGTPWCGHCQAAASPISKVLAAHPGVEYLKIEDGPGRRLGRSYRVKLWPTLIFLRDGEELDRVVRPTDEAAVSAAFEHLVGAAG